MTTWTRLPARAVLAIAGDDASTFLQGLISSDVKRLDREPAIYAALLSPQGKCHFDFLIARTDDGFLFDVEAARSDDLIRRLTLYRLRAKVTFEPRPELAVYIVTDAGAAPTAASLVDVVDPRLPSLGRRLIGVPETLEPELTARGVATTPETYTIARLRAGVPEGSGDLEIDKALLLESGFVELRGVDFDKGCFVGQELTARMRYRATVRKRLLPVAVTGEAGAGARIMDDEVEVGEIRTVLNGVGLALIRLDRWERAREAGRSLQAEAATVEPWVPDWIDLAFASKRAESSA